MPAAEITASIISAGAALASGGAQAASAGKSNKRTRKFLAEQNEKNRQFTEEQNEKSRQWTEKQIEKANEYNSLAAQMERAKQAGVNPYAVLGQSFNVPAATMAAQTSAQYNYADGSGALAQTDLAKAEAIGNMGSAVGQGLAAAATYAQTRKTNAEADKAEVDAELAKAERDQLLAHVFPEELGNYIYGKDGEKPTFNSWLDLRTQAAIKNSFYEAHWFKRGGRALWANNAGSWMMANYILGTAKNYAMHLADGGDSAWQTSPHSYPIGSNWDSQDFDKWSSYCTKWLSAQTDITITESERAEKAARLIMSQIKHIDSQTKLQDLEYSINEATYLSQRDKQLAIGSVVGRLTKGLIDNPDNPSMVDFGTAIIGILLSNLLNSVGTNGLPSLKMGTRINNQKTSYQYDMHNDNSTSQKTTNIVNEGR